MAGKCWVENWLIFSSVNITLLSSFAEIYLSSNFHAQRRFNIILKVQSTERPIAIWSSCPEPGLTKWLLNAQEEREGGVVGSGENMNGSLSCFVWEGVIEVKGAVCPLRPFSGWLSVFSHTQPALCTHRQYGTWEIWHRHRQQTWSIFPGSYVYVSTVNEENTKNME